MMRSLENLLLRYERDVIHTWLHSLHNYVQFAEMQTNTLYRRF